MGTNTDVGGSFRARQRIVVLSQAIAPSSALGRALKDAPTTVQAREEFSENSGQSCIDTALLDYDYEHEKKDPLLGAAPLLGVRDIIWAGHH